MKNLLRWCGQVLYGLLLGIGGLLAAMAGLYFIVYILPRLFAAFVLASGQDS